jgi:hypothetical protein
LGNVSRLARGFDAPISLALSQLFTMNAFDPLLWTLIACLFGIGALGGLTVLNKYAVIFWFSEWSSACV